MRYFAFLPKSLLFHTPDKSRTVFTVNFSYNYSNVRLCRNQLTKNSDARLFAATYLSTFVRVRPEQHEKGRGTWNTFELFIYFLRFVFWFLLSNIPPLSIAPEQFKVNLRYTISIQFGFAFR